MFLVIRFKIFTGGQSRRTSVDSVAVIVSWKEAVRGVMEQAGVRCSLE